MLLPVIKAVFFKPYRLTLFCFCFPHILTGLSHKSFILLFRFTITCAHNSHNGNVIIPSMPSFYTSVGGGRGMSAFLKHLNQLELLFNTLRENAPALDTLHGLRFMKFLRRGSTLEYYNYVIKTITVTVDLKSSLFLLLRYGLPFLPICYQNTSA